MTTAFNQGGVFDGVGESHDRVGENSRLQGDPAQLCYGHRRGPRVRAVCSDALHGQHDSGHGGNVRCRSRAPDWFGGSGWAAYFSANRNKAAFGDGAPAGHRCRRAHSPSFAAIPGFSRYHQRRAEEGNRTTCQIAVHDERFISENGTASARAIFFRPYRGASGADPIRPNAISRGLLPIRPPTAFTTFEGARISCGGINASR